MKKITFNPATTASLLFPSEDTSLVEALFRKRSDTLLLRLVRAVRQILQGAPKVAEETHLLSALQCLSSFSASTQSGVFAYPSFGFWIDVTEDLLRREAHVRLPNLHFAHHLRDLWRFAAAGALLDKHEEFVFDALSNGLGVVAIPATGTFFSCENLATHQDLSFETKRGEIISIRKRGAERLFTPIIGHVPRVLDGSVELNAIDEDLRLAGRTTYAYEVLRAEDLPRWTAALADAWSLLLRSCAPLAKEMILGIRALIPVVGSGVDTHTSASFSEAPGLIALSWHPDPTVLAEALVHEYHHQKLNSVQIVDPLILGPAGALFYSPWRPDPRPLTGILHGAFVFQAVLRWWDHLTPSMLPTLTSERIAIRKYVLCQQIISAMHTLQSNAKLTPLGAWLCTAIEDAVKVQAARVVDISPQAIVSVDRALDEHHKTWRHTNDEAWRESQRLLGIQGTNQDIHPDQRLLELLELSLASDYAPLKSTADNDALLERVVKLCGKQDVQLLRDALGPHSEFESGLRSTIRGHLAYAEEKFLEAAQYYAGALAKAPKSKPLWQSFAFSFRHLGRWNESSRLLSNLGMIVTHDLGLILGSANKPDEILTAALALIQDGAPIEGR